MNIRQVIQHLNPYEKWPTKAVEAKSKSLTVELLLDSVVCKTYNPDDESSRSTFLHEVEILHRLKGYASVPQLLYVDKSRTRLYISYCGPSVSVSDFNDAVRPKVDEILRQLETTWNVVEKTPLLTKRPKEHVRTINHKIYLVDFSSANWTIAPTPNTPIVNHTNAFVPGLST